MDDEERPKYWDASGFVQYVPTGQFFAMDIACLAAYQAEILRLRYEYAKLMGEKLDALGDRDVKPENVR